MLQLETARLRLLPCSEEMARAAISQRAELENLVGAHVPAAWPTPDLCDLLPFYADHLARDPAWLGWGVWLLLDDSARTLVGDAGFKGPPDAGTVEIGYGVLPAFQRRGYATEAARALVRWAFAQPQIEQIIAECLADNVPSIRVLQRLGMQPRPPAAPMLRWELRREAAR
ncbi:MAG TPA: GNAT family N-acetyltransferase [Herpetosiphonaceae bacterium]